MFSSLWNLIEKEFRHGTAVNRLVLLNCAVFALVMVAKLVDYLSNPMEMAGWAEQGAHYLMLPSNVKELLLRVWTPFTSMFLHTGFGHILFNMFALMLFGNIVGDLIGDSRVTPLYILGGLVGGLFFLAYGNLRSWQLGADYYAMGASGAVMAFAGAAVSLSPDYVVRLMLLGEVRLKFIVLFTILGDLVGIASDMNTGGHFAHLGGFFYGWYFVRALQFGDDPSERMNSFLHRVKNWIQGNPRRKKSTRKSSSNTQKRPEPSLRDSMLDRSGNILSRRFSSQNTLENDPRSHQEIIDSILEKIKEKGYDKLTSEEKKYLEDASKH